ncbi:MAG: magnesium transporter [Planctomycetota bacterium]|jgi:magnesium transporter
MADNQKILFEQVKKLLESQNTGLLRSMLADERTSNIAEIVELLDPEDAIVVFHSLEKPEAAEVFEKVDEATRSELFEELGEDELITLISELDPDDAADVLAELDKVESQEVLDQLDSEEAEQIKELMVYSEDSAGGIMDPIIVSVSENATVNEAVQRIQEAEIEEDFYSVFVVDNDGRFIGDVRLRLLLTNKGDLKINDLIDPDTITVTVEDDQEDVYNLFKKNDLIVVPVLDKDQHLVGRITADRILEVAEEEAAEDMYAMAGTDAAELETVSIFNAARIRMTWLLPCLAGTAITAIAIAFFSRQFILAGQIRIYLAAFTFIPMIAAISGNAGLQTSAIVVCGLATGDLAALKLSQVFIREVRIALLVALCCGLIGSLICSVLPNFFSNNRSIKTESIENSNFVTDTQLADTQKSIPDAKKLSAREHFKIAVAFGFAMFSAIMVATTLGLFLPFLFRHIGLDPAISSGPIVTTANDSISVAIYMLLTIVLTH